MIVILSFTGTGGGAASGPAHPAKNFSLGTLGNPGQQLSLNSLAGRPVIVNFFASWCEPCQKETPMLARFFRARHGERDDHRHRRQRPDTRSALAFVAPDRRDLPGRHRTVHRSHRDRLRSAGIARDTFFLDSRHRIVKRVYGAVTQAELTAGAALIGQRAK